MVDSGEDSCSRMLFDIADFAIDCLGNHLVRACQDNNVSSVEALVKDGADLERVDWFGNTPLCLSIFPSKSHLTTFLIDHGANIEHSNDRGNTPLCLAVLCHNSKDIVKTLLDQGAEIEHCNKDGNTPLCLAAASFNVDVVQTLIDHGALVNHANNRGKTPLHLQAHVSSGQADIARVLIDHGASVNSTDLDGNTPMFFAAHWGFQDIVQVLKVNGANINHRNAELCTPIMLAAEWSNTGLISFLIESGASLDYQDKHGISALMRSSRGDISCVQLLMDGGANPSLRDNDGLTVLSHFVRDVSGYSPQKHSRFFHLVFPKLRFLGRDFHLLILSNSPYITAHSVLQVTKVLPSLEYFNKENIFPQAMGSLKGLGLTPFRCALLSDNYDLARFFLTNWFLHYRDIAIRSRDKRFVLNSDAFIQTFENRKQFLDELFSQPWTLQSLSFVVVSTSLGFGPDRDDKVKRSGLCPMLQQRLQFQTSEWKTDSSRWSELTFSSVHMNRADSQSEKGAAVC